MYRSRILYSLIKIPSDFLIVLGGFLLAGFVRSRTDLIPSIQLPIQTIPENELIGFALLGAILWMFLFSLQGLYQKTPDTPLSEEIFITIREALSWFIFFIGIVYLGSGFIFKTEIPRLIIFFAYIFSTVGSIFLRILIWLIYVTLSRYKLIPKQKILIVGSSKETLYKDSWCTHYEHIEEEGNTEKIEKLIRDRSIDTLFYLGEKRNAPFTLSIIELCKIYGIRFAYPKIEWGTAHIPQRETTIGGTSVMEASSVTIEPFERVIKRAIDTIFSLIGLIILSPLLVLIALLIQLEDPSWPIIYKNRRVGMWGREFFLYKFRYMYWKYSIKDSYGISEKEDSALRYEEKLKWEKNTRRWPVYKIENDPRKTYVGRIIEKLSLDELPQLFNVLIGNMSLVWPRPHQPREVAGYEEYQYQVLTIKPGITGMAQTHGREQNNFEDEVALDTYYIEHYSLGLDVIILFRTIGVVFSRAFGR